MGALSEVKPHNLSGHLLLSQNFNGVSDAKFWLSEDTVKLKKYSLQVFPRPAE